VPPGDVAWHSNSLVRRSYKVAPKTHKTSAKVPTPPVGADFAEVRPWRFACEPPAEVRPAEVRPSEVRAIAARV